MADPFNPYKELYEHPDGPGDKRPTALRVVQDEDVQENWSGKVIFITGGTSGIGTEAARALHATGADVFFTARNFEKGQAALSYILSNTEGKGRLEVIEMDLDSLESVKKGAKDFLTKSEHKLNVLVNNAGIMATPQTKTADGFERQFGVNHLAHYTLTSLLLPALISSSSPAFNSRVISLSSSSHRYTSIHWEDVNLTDEYEPYLAYGQSKTANIWMANYIDRVYGPKGVHGLSVHPGGIWSGLQRDIDEETKAKWRSETETMRQMMSPEQGAATTVWAAVGKAWEGRGGKYLNNCAVSELAKDLKSTMEPGYAPHAYDEDGENRLWNLSIELTGVRPDI